jgi:hypothetical protein
LLLVAPGVALPEVHHACAPVPRTRQVAAWLRCKLDQTLAGLREAAPGSVAGLQGDGARAYALGFMGEYLSPPRLAQLAEACQLQPAGAMGAVCLCTCVA